MQLELIFSLFLVFDAGIPKKDNIKIALILFLNQ